jgi:hypothetical protein
MDRDLVSIDEEMPAEDHDATPENVEAAGEERNDEIA